MIKVENLTKIFGTKRAVDVVSFTVELCFLSVIGFSLFTTSVILRTHRTT